MAGKIKDKIEFNFATRLLRCERTHRYFTGRGWSEDPQQAVAFSDGISAAHACAKNGLENVELVVRPPGCSTDLFTTRVR